MYGLLSSPKFFGYVQKLSCIHSQVSEEKWNQFGQIHLGTDLNFNQLCEKIGQQLQIPYLKLANKSPKVTYYLKGDYHYSPKGNKWAARSIQEYLIKGGYLQ